jgi:hypothetical protein
MVFVAFANHVHYELDIRMEWFVFASLRSRRLLPSTIENERSGSKSKGRPRAALTFAAYSILAQEPPSNRSRRTDRARTNQEQTGGLRHWGWVRG